MRVTEVHGQFVSADGCFITDAGDNQRFAERGYYALHHIGDEHSVKTVHGLGFFKFVMTFEGNDVAVHLNVDSVSSYFLGQSSLGSLNGDQIIFVIYGYACGNGDVHSTNS